MPAAASSARAAGVVGGGRGSRGRRDLGHAGRLVPAGDDESPQRVGAALDRLIHRHPGRPQGGGGRPVGVHGVDHRRTAGGGSRLADQRGRAQLLSGDRLAVLAVAAEVPGDEQGVDLVAAQELAREAVESVHVALGATGEVDGVGHGRAGGKLIAQRRCEDVRQMRDLQTRVRRDAGGDAAVPATVGEDPDPPPPRRRAAQQRRRGVDHLPGRAHPLDARRAAGGVDHRAVGGQCSRVRAHGAGRGVAVLDRQGEHRLAGVGGQRRRAGELPSVAEILDVEGEQPRLVVAGQLGDQLGGAHIRLVAQGDEA